MTHPTREEMMEHLYGENSSARKAAINEHLRTCSECRGRSDAWRRTMATLDGWRLPSPRRAPFAPFAPALRRAAAAALLIGLGVVVGHLARPGAASIQEAVRKEVATQVAVVVDQQRTTLAAELRAAAAQSAGAETRQLLAAFAGQLDERRVSDAEVLYGALQQMDTRHTEDVARLRRDLDTVAVVADARLVDAQEQILQLANASPGTANK